MVRRSQVGWVEINIKTPVKRWVKRPNKNFGIEVRVEDANQRKVDPFTVFKGFECTSENGEGKRLYHAVINNFRYVPP